MKILITGGSSYIGNAIISTFKDFYFYALLNENPIIQSPNVKSFTDNELKACFKNNDIDLIIHLASFSYRDDDQKYSEKIYDTNYNLGKKLIEYSENTGVKKFINMGSYSQIVFKDPPNLYTETKNLFLDYLKDNVNSFEAGVTNLYLGDLYGPHDSRNKLIPFLLKNENKKIISFNSNGEGAFAPIHLQDTLEVFKEEISFDYNCSFSNRILCPKVENVKSFVNKYKKFRNKNFSDIYLDSENIYSSFMQPKSQDYVMKVSLEKGLSKLL